MTTTQQISAISEIKIKLPRNAKLFFDNNRGLFFLVHYDHVILTLANTIPKKVLSCYVGSPTSQSAIYDVLRIYVMNHRFVPITEIYESLGKTDEQRKSDRGDYARKNTGIGWSPRLLKGDWEERILALEKYDYTKGNYLWQ